MINYNINMERLGHLIKLIRGPKKEIPPNWGQQRQALIFGLIALPILGWVSACGLNQSPVAGQDKKPSPPPELLRPPSTDELLEKIGIDDASKETTRTIKRILKRPDYQRYPELGQIEQQIDKFLTGVAAGDFELAVVRNHPDVLTTGHYRSRVGITAGDLKFRVEIYTGSPSIPSEEEMSSFFHELVHAADDLSTYLRAKAESERTNTSFLACWQKLSAEASDSERAWLRARGINTPPNQAFPTGYMWKKELWAMAVEASFQAGLSKKEKENLRLANPAVRFSNEHRVFDLLFQKYGSIKALFESIEWRWFIERKVAFWEAPEVTKKPHPIILTAVDQDVERAHPGFLDFIRRESVFFNSQMLLLYDPTENNSYIRGLLAKK